MSEVITQDELIQYLEEYEARIKELEAFVSKVAFSKITGDQRIESPTLYLESILEELEAEALALLEP